MGIGSAMLFGWSGTILNIDLSEEQVTLEDTVPYTKKYLGGRILAARLAWERIPLNAGPFDRENVILITAGPLVGTPAPTSGRTVMSMISPAPHPFPWYSHSTLGGWFGPQMKYAGYDAILVKGKASRKVYLEIIDEKVEIKSADTLWGRDAIETQEMLKRWTGPFSQVLTIGPAGENLLRMATVQHDYDCAAGHSGFGAVWGSKNLKAIVVKGTKGVQVHDPDLLMQEVQGSGRFPITPAWMFSEYKNENDARHRKPGPICSQGCTNNCRVGTYLEMPDGRTTKSFCIVHALTKFMQSEYCPTGSSLKLPKAATFDCENSLTLLEKFNRLGIDFWSRITFQVWLTALVEAGIGSIREYRIFPGDGGWFHGFIDDMVSRRRLGAMFADGLARALDRLQGEIPRELIDLGREIVFAYGFQAHREGRFWDREPLPYWVFSAMMYVGESRDPTIGSHSLLHMAELQLNYGETALKKFRTLSSKVWNDSRALEPSFGNKARVAIWCQRMHFLIDSLTMCDFAFPKLIKYYPHERGWLDDDDIYGDLELDRRLLSAVTGVNFSRQELDAAADRGLSIERCMLARAGRTRELEEKLASHFELPCRDDGTKTSREDFLELMDQYYQARGWDKKFGWPLSGTLHRLGLSDVQKEMRVLRSARRLNSG